MWQWNTVVPMTSGRKNMRNVTVPFGGSENVSHHTSGSG